MSLNCWIALRAKSATQDADSIALIEEFGTVMIDVVAFVQQVANVNNLDDAWNLTATFLDLVAVDRLREQQPETLAVLRARQSLYSLRPREEPNEKGDAYIVHEASLASSPVTFPTAVGPVG